MSTLQPLKILFTGVAGAGKTTAIATLSETAVVTTDVANTDLAKLAEEHTAVALDYGECTLETGERVLLCSTTGQDPFDFMWQILMRGAAGTVVLVDNTRPDPLSDLEMYLDAFSELADRGAMVIGVGRTESAPEPAIRRFHELLTRRGQMAHVLRVDVRKKSDVLMLVDALLAQIEVPIR